MVGSHRAANSGGKRSFSNPYLRFSMGKAASLFRGRPPTLVRSRSTTSRSMSSPVTQFGTGSVARWSLRSYAMRSFDSLTTSWSSSTSSRLYGSFWSNASPSGKLCDHSAAAPRAFACRRFSSTSLCMDSRVISSVSCSRYGSRQSGFQIGPFVALSSLPAAFIALSLACGSALLSSTRRVSCRRHAPTTPSRSFDRSVCCPSLQTSGSPKRCTASTSGHSPSGFTCCRLSGRLSTSARSLTMNSQGEKCSSMAARFAPSARMHWLMPAPSRRSRILNSSGCLQISTATSSPKERSRSTSAAVLPSRFSTVTASPSRSLRKL
mmetsp:Transcript_54373/g.140088  ORF Transcript_54373/g.140088 Transcript_54373/m.140088 type:complete len:322 (+) Transcript_54373:203-1168(+)